MDKSFPALIDSADVIFYSNERDYGKVRYSSGLLYDRISSFAICQYPGDSQFYLFALNDKYEVVSDWLLISADQAKEVASSFCSSIVWNRRCKEAYCEQKSKFQNYSDDE